MTKKNEVDVETLPPIRWIETKDRFCIGDRVEFHEPALKRSGLLSGATQRKHVRTGTVRGFGPSAYSVKVQRDGFRGISSYHGDFWNRIQPKLKKEPTR